MRGRGLVLLLWAALAVGCARPEALPIDETIFPDGGRDYRDYRILGWSHDGRPVVSYVFGRGKEKVVIVGGQHGDAPAVPALLDRLMDFLTANPDYLAERTVIVVPRLNPDGLAVNQRTNIAMVDLDRNLPTRDWRRYAATGSRAASEPETRALLFLLRRVIPRRLLVIRAPLNQIVAYGDVTYYATELRDRTRYALREDVTRSPSGSLARFAREAKWPTLVWDLERREPWPGMWDQLRDGLLSFIGPPKPVLPE